jgi:hypothetical protein
MAKAIEISDKAIEISDKAIESAEVIDTIFNLDT